MTMFERLSATYPMQLQSQSLQQLLLQLQLLLLLWQVGPALRRCLAMKNVAKRHINWRYCCRSSQLLPLFLAFILRFFAASRCLALCGHRIDVLCISGTIWTSERADYTVRIIMSKCGKYEVKLLLSLSSDSYESWGIAAYGMLILMYKSCKL